jgi:hypothetical protein
MTADRDTVKAVEIMAKLHRYGIQAATDLLAGALRDARAAGAIDEFAKTLGQTSRAQANRRKLTFAAMERDPAFDDCQVDRHMAVDEKDWCTR